MRGRPCSCAFTGHRPGKLPWGEDETMVQQSYTPGCMQRRNRYMVDHASLLIAVNDGARGGTRSTIEYAFKRGVNVLDIPLD